MSSVSEVKCRNCAYMSELRCTIRNDIEVSPDYGCAHGLHVDDVEPGFMTNSEYREETRDER